MDAKIAVYNQTLIESDVHGKILSLKNNNFLMVWLPYNYIVNIVHVSSCMLSCFLCQMRNKKKKKKKKKIVFVLCFYLFSYCKLKLVTCVNAEFALVNFTIFVQTMGVTVSEVFKNDFLIVSFRSSVQRSTRFIVWTLPTIVLLKI